MHKNQAPRGGDDNREPVMSGQGRPPAPRNARAAIPNSARPALGGRRPAAGGALPAPAERRAPAADRPAAGVPAAQAPPPDGKTRVKAAPVKAAPAKPGGKKKAKLRPGTIFGTIVLNCFKALFVLFCVGVIVGSIIAVQVVQYVVEATNDDANRLDLNNYATIQTSYVHAYNPDNPNAREEDDWIVYQELVGEEDRIWVDYADIPEYMIQAVIATEDRKFYEHHGVNFERTIYALANELLGLEDSSFGASTITQQLVKNITKEDEVADAEGDKSAGYLRKLREIFRAWGLENRYHKTQILEAYMNTIGLSERIAGIGAGAKKYFNVEAKDLTLAQCATIAGITQAPSWYSPFYNPENCLKRRDDVILFMLQCEYITQEEAEAVWATGLGLAPREEVGENEAGMNVTGSFSWLTDKAYNDVIRDLMEQKGWSRAYASEQLYNGGYHIYLTADLNVQQALDDMMVHGYDRIEDGAAQDGFFMNQEMFPNYKDRLEILADIRNNAGQKIGSEYVLPQAAVIVLNYKGELIATSGGIGEKVGSLGMNRGIGVMRDGRAAGGVRQSGSTMKLTAAYPMAMDYGIITYSKMIPDASMRSRNPYNPEIDPETGAPIFDWPLNYGGGTREGTPIPVVSAIAESTNTVAARVGNMVGIEEMYEFLTDTLDVTTLVDADMDLAPLVLGSQTYGMSLYELAGAYMMYGGNDTYGQFTTLHSYLRVEDSQGNIILEPKISTVQAIDPQTGYILNRALYNVVHDGAYPGGAYPTAGGVYPNVNDIPAIGKTGTTTEDNDRVFVGLTPYYVTGVWWGYDEEHTLLQEGGKGWPAGARNNIPVNVWKALMNTVQEPLEYKDFPAVPEGVRQLQFCTASGDLWQEGCPGAMTGYYADFKVPEPCRGHADDPPPEA